jgi:predicted AlkP superfamily phosphohydrolase/phosphomutase
MPNLRRLAERSARASLRTTDPPISIPAWPVMFTGVDPGTLGLYGFRHRSPGSYTQMTLPTSKDLPVPTIWQILSERGYRVGVVGMPPGYPPPSVNGVYVSDFLTPPSSDVVTHPASLRQQIEEKFGPYTFDVVFRSSERERLARELMAMTRQRFAVSEWLYASEPWDVFAVHEIGTDRLHHAYWKHFDPTHPEFIPGNPYEHLAEEYYALIDEGIGRMLAHADARTDVLLVSDHGSMAMNGCFAVNQWLAQKGYLALTGGPPAAGTPIEKASVDWAKTTAWGAGGYYARIFFNLRGRETQGSVDPSRLPELKAQLARDLAGLRDESGRPLPVRILDPQEIYRFVRGEAPDLIVYFDELKWRAAGTLGHPSLFLPENDTGPDDAVHSFDGVFLFYDHANPVGRTLPELQIRDVTPTLLALLGERVPAHIQGHVMPQVVATPVPMPH